MNKKGFTIVELLAVIAIISILAGIAAFAYTSVVSSSKMRSFKAYERTMYAETVSLLMDSLTDPSKSSYFPSNGQTKHLSLTDIGIEPFNNPVNKSDLCPTSYVEVTRDDYVSSSVHVDAFKYKVCLICTQSDYNVTGQSCLFIPEE